MTGGKCEMRNEREWGPGVICGRRSAYKVTFTLGQEVAVCPGCASLLRSYKAPIARMESILEVAK